VQENFSGGDSMHLRGTSVSTFDAASHKWKQTWVDNEGGCLDFVGGFKDGQMILQREAVRNGVRMLQRMVWKNISADEMDWSWEASRDGGKTWEVKWPIHYKRKSWSVTLRFVTSVITAKQAHVCRNISSVSGFEA
jgi:hypothetical protein